MRALFLEPDQAWLEERRRRGQDRFDEVWDGVYHVVPGPNVWHQRFESELEAFFRPLAKSLGLEVFHNTDVLDRAQGETNYRQPDIAIVSPNDLMASGRGIDGHAELVVEIRSPNDESYEKLPFYEACAIPEYWIVHPQTRVFEVFVLHAGAYVTAQPDAGGIVHAPRFGLSLEMIDGPKLRITWSGGSAEI